MDRAEIAWRLRAGSQTALDRARASISPFKWDRRGLVEVLAPVPELEAVRQASGEGRWQDAHEAFSRVVVRAPGRFVISPSCRARVVNLVREQFPRSVKESSAIAERLIDGRYDLLGYEGLRFGRSPDDIDWHADPVNGRSAPTTFWTTVPFLDEVCGDHKIIWELNRHQHWLSLGRAFWLTGDERFRRRVLAELASWLAANPPLTGINWASMLELAFRSISWTWALNFFVRDTHEPRPAEEPWTIDLLLALDRQLDHIERNLSYYFSPNTHLLGEALALYVTSRALPVFRSSRRREAVGRAILCAQASRQIEADGGHAERSTHYHRYALDFYLLALASARIGNPDVLSIPCFEDACSRLASAARLLADDRGRLPHLGDDDGGSTMPIVPRGTDDVSGSLSMASRLLGRPELSVGPLAEESCWLLADPALAGRLDAVGNQQATQPLGSGALPQTGYYVSRSTHGDHLVIDGGPHGFQNGGHAHADALSLTLTHAGSPFLIDPGTGSYTADPVLRDRFRSSASHNTLTVDQRSQSMPHGPFHWVNQANAYVRQWQTGGDFDYFEATHDAYLPLVHRRHVLMRPGDLLVVADVVIGTGVHRLDVHWHLDPRWRTEVSGARATFELVSDPDTRLALVLPRGTIELFVADENSGLGWYSPVYGRVEPCAALRISTTTELPACIVSAFQLSRSNDIISVRSQARDLEAASQISIRIDRTEAVDLVTFGDGHARFTRLEAVQQKIAG